MKKEIKFWISSILLTILLLLFSYLFLVWVSIIIFLTICFYLYYKIKKLFKNEKRV